MTGPKETRADLNLDRPVLQVSAALMAALVIRSFRFAALGKQAFEYRRGASVRVPHSFVDSGYKGYLEDRRPNSQGDPYKIAGRILQTIATVPTPGGKKAKK